MERNVGEIPERQSPSRGRADPSIPTPNTLVSITRLVVGGVLLGLDGLSRQLPEWERQATQNSALREQPASRVEASGEGQPSGSAPPPLGETSSALLGLMFQSEDLLKRGTSTLGRIERATWRLTSPVHRPLRTWRLFEPARRQYDRLAERGETRVNRWAELGRAEAQHSRALTESAIQGTFERSMDELAQAPQIQDLVTQQTTSMAGEMIDEVRSRTVSADTLAEGIVRRLLRRPARVFRLEPPVYIQPEQQNQKTRT